MLETKLSKLDELLKDGLHLHNLSAMMEICRDVDRTTETPLPSYVLLSVFADLSKTYSGRPLPSVTHEEVSSALVPLIKEVLQKLLDGASGTSLYDPLNRLIREHIRVQTEVTSLL